MANRAEYFKKRRHDKGIKFISIGTDKEHFDRLDEIVKAEGITKTKWLENAIDNYEKK